MGLGSVRKRESLPKRGRAKLLLSLFSRNFWLGRSLALPFKNVFRQSLKRFQGRKGLIVLLFHGPTVHVFST